MTAPRTGFQDLLRLLAEHGDTPDDPVPIAIETSRGLMVACLRASGRQVFAINPMAVARYRDRHSVSRKKSDHQDAVVLANILRTDAELHRPLPGDTELVSRCCRDVALAPPGLRAGAPCRHRRGGFWSSVRPGIGRGRDRPVRPACWSP